MKATLLMLTLITVSFMQTNASVINNNPSTSEIAEPNNTLNRNSLNAGDRLKAGEKLFSANGAYMLRMQEEDGNLCIYKAENGKQGAFVWCSMAHGFKNGVAIMQADGNFVVYDANNNAKWASNTHPYNDARFKDTSLKPVKLVLENDGTLKLYNATGKAVWSNK